MTPFDPVHEHEGAWYFWDEIQLDRIGPYKDEREARQQHVIYCEKLSGSFR